MRRFNGHLISKFAIHDLRKKDSTVTDFKKVFLSDSFFYTRHFKKCGVLCYTLRLKICVRYVRPSVSASFSLSFSSNLV